MANVKTIHDPDRFIADLRQVLSQGRKRIGLLIGAGAPMSIRIDTHRKLADDGVCLIPGVDELTTLVSNGLKEKGEREAVAALSRAIGPKANIEQILSQVRLMQKALGAVKVHGLDSQGYYDLGVRICEQISKVVDTTLPDDRCAYHELVAWISGTLRTHAVEIFCSNYDLLFEEAFELARSPYYDGFSGSSSPFFDPVSVASDDLPPRWSRLWKLHGSIGWSLEKSGIVRTGNRSASQLIYPDHLKYDLTQKQPYSALFERLRQFLLNPDTLLLATGFSFRDAHINAVIEESLAMNSNAAAIAFQFGSLAQEEPVCRMAADRPNLSVYAADGAVISGIEGSWRPGLVEKRWQEIRPTFWGTRSSGEEPKFLLGDFAKFARFCALSQARGLEKPQATTSAEIALGEEAAGEG